MSQRVGVCSWSLQPETAADLAQKVKAVGLSAVQIALDPLGTGAWAIAETVSVLAEAGIAIRSGMMRMQGEDYSTLESIRRTGGVRLDEHWGTNLSAAQRNADVAREMGIDLVTFHAGFLPHERSDPVRTIMLERLRAIVDRFADCGVRVGFETGQETADTLADALDELDRPAAGVNFDPANMVLYGVGDPVAGLRKLAPRVVQIHVKDAVATKTQGTWGTEVPVGDGDVDYPALFEVVTEARLECDFMIEREAGGRRAADIRRARERVERFINAAGGHRP